MDRSNDKTQTRNRNTNRDHRNDRPDEGKSWFEQLKPVSDYIEAVTPHLSLTDKVDFGKFDTADAVIGVVIDGTNIAVYDVRRHSLEVVQTLFDARQTLNNLRRSERGAAPSLQDSIKKDIQTQIDYINAELRPWAIEQLNLPAGVELFRHVQNQSSYMVVVLSEPGSEEEPTLHLSGAEVPFVTAIGWMDFGRLTMSRRENIFFAVDQRFRRCQFVGISGEFNGKTISDQVEVFLSLKKSGFDRADLAGQIISVGTQQGRTYVRKNVALVSAEAAGITDMGKFLSGFMAAEDKPRPSRPVGGDQARAAFEKAGVKPEDFPEQSAAKPTPPPVPEPIEDTATEVEVEVEEAAADATESAETGDDTDQPAGDAETEVEVVVEEAPADTTDNVEPGDDTDQPASPADVPEGVTTIVDSDDDAPVRRGKKRLTARQQAELDQRNAERAERGGKGSRSRR